MHACVTRGNSDNKDHDEHKDRPEERLLTHRCVMEPNKWVDGLQLGDAQLVAIEQWRI